MRTGMRTCFVLLTFGLLFTAGVAVAARVGSASTSNGGAPTGASSTVVSSVPGAPTLVSATATSAGVALLWNPPASDGGSPITYYRIYRGTASGEENAIATVGSVTQYTDPSTVKGTTYVYQVAALNAAGEGARSNELAVTASGPVAPPLFQPYQVTSVGSSPEAVAIGDVTGDGRPDVVMTTGFNFDAANDYRLFVFAQGANGGFLPPASYATAGGYGNRPTSVAIGDITGDGRADVAVGIAAVGVQVFPQLSSGGLGSPTLTSTPDAGKIRLGRLNGDSRLDVAGVGWGTNTASVLLNNGTGGLSSPVQYAVQHDGYEDLEIADVTNDGLDDLVVMSGQGRVPNVSVLPQLSAGGFGTRAEYSVGTNVLTNGIGIGDVTGDGRKDVVATYGGNSPAFLSVFAQTASATLGAPVSYSSSEFPAPVDAADLDLDARPDVLVVHSASVGVYRQRAAGTLAAEEVYSIPASEHNPHGLAIGDVNSDGSPDVAIASARNGLVILRNTTPVVAPNATVPGAPTLTSATAGQGSVALTWDAPLSDGGTVVTGYKIYRGTAAGAETFLRSTGAITSFSDAAVVAGTTYYYRLSATNAVGEGAQSNERPASLAAATVPDAPTLSFASPGYNSVTLSWNPAWNGGAAITGYNVYRGTASGGETLLATVGTVTYYTDAAAVGGTAYFYEVTALNSVGESAPSNEVPVTPTTPTVPGAPSLTSATAGIEKVSLAWTPPAFSGGAEISGYRVYRGTAPGAESLLATLGSATAYTDTSGVDGTTYFYQVTAVNSVGESAQSNERSATPYFPQFQPYEATPVGSYPEAVAIGDVTGDGRNDVVMTTGFYFDPENDYHLFVFRQAPNGTLLPPVSYPTGGGSLDRPQSVAVGDITGDGRADVVVGLDRVGVQVFPQLASGLLGTPTFTATVDSTRIRLGRLNGDNRLDVAGVGWATDTASVLLNDGNGGLAAPVTYTARHGGYDDLEVADVTSDGRDDLVVMSGQGYAVPDMSVLAQLAGGGFAPAVEYNVPGDHSVTSGIGVGDVTGDGRADVVASLGENAPISAAAVFAQTTSGTLAPSVSYAGAPWPGPVEVADLNRDGSAEVVVVNGNYQSAGVFRQASGGTLATEEELYALPYATRYNAQGLAVGDVNGDGAPDVVIADYNSGLVVLRNTAGALPPSLPTPPGAPELQPLTTSGGNVTLTWSAPPSNGGAQIGAYKVYRGTSSGGETLLTTIGTANSFTDTAVGGSIYYYEVAAVNSVGEGARSNERKAPVATVPGAPTLTSAAAGNSSVGLTWTAPGSNGGASITAYKVYRSTTSGGETLLTTVGNVNSFTDTTAVNGNTYFYDVSAVNSVGEGAASNERAATPATVPGAPTLTAAVAGGSSVALAWNAPASNGGAQITGYDVYRGTTSGGETLLTTLGSMSTYIDASLSAGTTYYYTVSAVNSRGEGARSNELSATPDATPPAKPAGVKLVVAGTNQLALDWEASTDNVGVSRYNVFRNNVLVGTVTETQYLDSGLTAGASYTYQVRAVDAAGNFSQPSSNLTAKTFAVSNVATGTLAGAVYDATGKRLANAIVTLVVSGGTKTAKTNASGAWKISNLPPATYAPIVSLKGYRSHTLSMSAEAGKTVLAAATLTV